MIGQVMDFDTLMQLLHHVEDRLIDPVSTLDTFHAPESIHVKEGCKQGIQTEIGIFDILFGNTPFKGRDDLIELLNTIIGPGFACASDRNHPVEVIPEKRASFSAEMDPVYGPGSIIRGPVGMWSTCGNDKIGVGTDFVDLVVDEDRTASINTIDQDVLGDTFFTLAVMILGIGIETYVGNVEIRYERIVENDLQLLLRQDKASVTGKMILFTGHWLRFFMVLFHTARFQDFTGCRKLTDLPHVSDNLLYRPF